MSDRVKIYEEKEKKGVPIWAWLLLLLFLAALAYYFLSHRKDEPAGVSSVPAQTAHDVALPDLGAVRFDTDRATLSSDGRATLQRAAAALKANPAAHLRVEGLPDNLGTLPHDATISQERTLAVVEFLKGEGIDGSRLTGHGFDQAEPVDTNATATGEADRRRVELFSQQ